MSTTIYKAAADLQRKIKAPAGAVNTMAQTLSAPHFIRVLIDPMYWYAVQDVPSEFEGYPVTIEKREAAQALLQ